MPLVLRESADDDHVMGNKLMSISRIKNNYARRAAIVLYVPLAILFTGLMNFLLWVINVFEVDEWIAHARKVWKKKDDCCIDR